jgi:hypothetical protein
VSEDESGLAVAGEGGGHVCERGKADGDTGRGVGFEDCQAVSASGVTRTVEMVNV